MTIADLPAGRQVADRGVAGRALLRSIGNGQSAIQVHPMTRWLGIDHGTVRIGVAVGDSEQRLAVPVEVVPAQPVKVARRRLAELAREYQADGLVVGLPLNMDDTEGPQAKLARAEAAAIGEATGLPVEMFDERLSSFEADRRLAGQFTRKQKKARHDAVAAAAMLEGFLKTKGADGPQPPP